MPQYRLALTAPTSLLIRAETGNPDIVLELDLLKWPEPPAPQHPAWCGRVDRAPANLRVARGMGKEFACIEAGCAAGTYTLVVRTTSPPAPGQKDQFVVRLEAADAAAGNWRELEAGGAAIPAEGHGLRTLDVPGQWTAASGGHARLAANPMWKLLPSTATTVTVRCACLPGPPPRATCLGSRWPTPTPFQRDAGVRLSRLESKPEAGADQGSAATTRWFVVTSLGTVPR